METKHHEINYNDGINMLVQFKISNMTEQDLRNMLTDILFERYDGMLSNEELENELETHFNKYHIID